MKTQTENSNTESFRHPEKIRQMFARIAPAYDFLNHALSANIDKLWRKRVVRKLKNILENPNALVLDVACGTGDLAIEMKKYGKAKIIGTDFCRPMLEIAKRKNLKNQISIPYVEGDGLNLPFSESSFDAVTIAFGLRNFSNWEKGLKEAYRVLKIGGKLLVLEFSTPVVPGFKQLFNFYFNRILPAIGGIISGSRIAYEYLPDSVSKFPNQQQLAEMMKKVGFKSVEYENLTGGVAAIHLGQK
ncbi:MAG: bifunctional demethylmenaquinone methyltransferase/2-methoxy-6-polyprenyl-1,4-benzoquinol methylase UbiE [Acidobacteria bacterium]|jgi:demethylmenaquinone methyltransferase/2-methoxy-6-polyprenyl-1,4-benzoquinol methylase|nr:MAG: bifunctional demethylmenaquinone methyltransferase/2-methoxy-6-polyprenyl-1,4-benzoquinol methylase UbiE [Acidobacteriota bacterium]GIU82703.1 MAG: demethylmenaquinone methyltransferase [Pyrinomonadaceae bacterium]